MGLGKLKTSNPAIQVIGWWSRWLGLGASALVPWRRRPGQKGQQSCNYDYWLVGLDALA